MNKTTLLIFLMIIICLSSCSPEETIISVEPKPSNSSIPSLTVTSTQTVTPSQTPALEMNILVTDMLLINGDFELAYTTFFDLINHSNDNTLVAESLWGLSRIEYHRGYYDQSLHFIEELHQRFPDSPSTKRSYYLQGLNYDELSRYSDAADAYLKYLNLNPGIIDSHTQEKMGDSLSNNGDYQSALNAYESISDPLDNTFTLDIKIAKMYKAIGNYSSSIEIYQKIFENTQSDYLKAQMDFSIGEVFYSQGLFEDAYPYFNDAVINYPASYDSFSSLFTLVNDGIPVDDFNRGLVNYFIGNFGSALSAFDRYIDANPVNDGTVYHFKALTLRDQGEYQSAVNQWTSFINDFPNNQHWDSAWYEKSYTLWGFLENYQEGAQTLLDYSLTYPTKTNAPYYLNSAARILERGEFLEDAYSTWVQLSIDYPESELVPDALFNAGIVKFRLKDYLQAKIAFQKGLILFDTPSLQARSYLWIGKSQLELGEEESARQSFQLSAGLDPTDYYSLRAQDLLIEQEGFLTSDSYDFSFNLEKERADAETWIRISFQLPSTLDLGGLGELFHEDRIIRGTEYWKLGLYDYAQIEFNDLFQSIVDKPENCYRLANYLQELGFHRLAINSYRQLLVLAGMETYSQMLNAPIFFLHMNYGVYFKEFIVSNAEIYNLDPLLIMSIIAQESAFDVFINSPVGAIGLMQIMPATGESVAKIINWPADYSLKELIRPIVNIRFGAANLTMNRNYYDGDLYLTLAAYNAGPGNVDIWRELSGDDQDLFLEVIRYPETRNYIENIYEIFSVYKMLYEVK